MQPGLKSARIEPWCAGSPVLAVVLATILGLLTTPVIIGRSRNVLIRRGVRSEVPPAEDPRWRL